MPIKRILTTPQRVRRSPRKLAAPVYPNAGVEAWYRTQLQDIVTKMAGDMLRRIRGAWIDSGMATDANAKRPSSLLVEKALSQWGAAWTNRINEGSRKIAWDFAARNASATDAGVKRSLADAGFTVKFRPTKASKDVLRAVLAENVGLIKSIPQKYLTEVQTVVWQGVMAGSDLRTMSDQLAHRYGVTFRRAALIARDQNAKAKAAMERARREEVGLENAVWMHTDAGVDPRWSHKNEMNGNEYPISEGMWDPMVKKYVWPGTEINCRCVDKAVIPGFG
jgi:uncharacterized protein with gpF-like domain